VRAAERSFLGVVRPIATAIACGLLLTAAGLIHRDFIHCSKLDPTHPIPASNYFEARGFPNGWLTSDNGTCGQLRGVPEESYGTRFSTLPLSGSRSRVLESGSSRVSCARSAFHRLSSRLACSWRG
jgi:hypothetical protein